jgi:hypothetical protein
LFNNQSGGEPAATEGGSGPGITASIVFTGLFVGPLNKADTGSVESGGDSANTDESGDFSDLELYFSNDATPGSDESSKPGTMLDFQASVPVPQPQPSPVEAPGPVLTPPLETPPAPPLGPVPDVPGSPPPKSFSAPSPSPRIPFSTVFTQMFAGPLSKADTFKVNNSGDSSAPDRYRDVQALDRVFSSWAPVVVAELRDGWQHRTGNAETPCMVGANALELALPALAAYWVSEALRPARYYKPPRCQACRRETFDT